MAAGAGLRHRAAQRRDHRRQVQAEEEHVRHGSGDGAAPRSQRLGSEPRRVRSGEFQPRGRGQAPGQRLEAVRQRPARLHRPRLCDARGGAGDRHDPAALQADRQPPLPDAPEGNADDQAGRLQDQGAAARRQGSRRLRRSRRRGRRRLERCRAAGADPPGTQHAAAGALRLQPRHRGRAGDAGGRPGRGQRLCDQAGRARRLRRQAAGTGRGADLLRLLQWRGPRQRHAVRQMARRRPAEGCVRQGALCRVRLRQQRLGGDLPVGAAHDRRATRQRMARAASMPAARAMPAATSTASSKNGSRRQHPRR